jgi:hypothetical protein
MNRYIALSAWSLVTWISWNPLINGQQHSSDQNDVNIIHLIGKLLFILLICTSILLFEKFSIQWIAGKFHERSYAGW